MADVAQPILAFDTDDFEFARGVEIGRLWEQFKSGEEIDQMIHAENAEMVMRIGESTDRVVTATEAGDGWMHLKVEAI